MEVDETVDSFFYKFGWILFGLGVVGIIILKTVGTTILDVIPPCYFHTATGWYCPGCGGTRAAYMLFKGHPIYSLYFNPIVLYGAILVVCFMFTQTLERVSKGSIKIGMHFRTIYVWIGLAIILTNFAVKNYFLVAKGIALLG